ncbi:hypothetical protein F5876DRAFT_80832 [Lentinula aff. lateritia]|uniref:Uncharacterized protein n=1 Tax=Lentinula aff. lateritia TaxID=2804960 RepID=A0ACC1TNR9_9AGAR|nr:hypothetical protein F5876DRAFT_80832 [Lentinula aff. lateritia]
MDVNARLASARRQIEAIRALDALRAQRQRILTEEEKRAREIRTQRNGRSAVEFAPTRSDELEHELDKVATKRARKRRMEKGKGKEEEDDAIEGKALARIIRNVQRQLLPPPFLVFPHVALERPNGILFVYPPKSNSDSTSRESSSFPSHGSNFDSQSSSPSSAPSVSPTTSPVPNFASTAYVGPPPLILTVIPSSNTSISRPGTPIRCPPLPTTLPSSPGSGTSSPSVKTPLASPNLATYRAPEELVNLEDEDYFAGPSTSALASASEHVFVADDEDDDTETLDGHEVDEGEDSTSPLIPDHGEMDEEIRAYFREEATDGSDEGESDIEPELMMYLPEPEARNVEQHEEPHAVDPQDGNENAGVEVYEDEEEDEEEDEDEDGEDEIAKEFQVRPQLQEGAAVAFNAGNLAEDSTEEIVHSTPKTGVILSFLAQTLPDFMDYVESCLAALGREIRQSHKQFCGVWTQLAIGNGPAERIFSVIFGYCIIASALVVYMNILTIGNVKTAGRAVRTAVKQQLLVLKVASFIFIELVTFPLGCGVVLDISMLWFFPGATYVSRIEFSYQAPLTAIFYHWVAGTMFMFVVFTLDHIAPFNLPYFAGGMCFIKDPQDQNAHPICDILERAALVQLRKICISGIMYTFVVVCTVFSVAALLFLGQKIILPIRWKTREPLSNIPIDLLFLNIALPYTMTYFHPQRALRKFTMVMWKGLARRLRLTSYLSGLRLAEEEYAPKKFSLSRIIYGPSKDTSILVEDYDGSFRRVPNTDDLAIPRDLPATVAVTATGEPVNEEAMILIGYGNGSSQA